MDKFQIVKAVKFKEKLRLAIDGPTGAGKTYTALNIAKYFGNNLKTVLIDTERNSARKFADIFSFNHLPLNNHHPTNYRDAVQHCVDEGYEIIIVDSWSHAWMGEDGALALVDRAAERSRSKNTFIPWREVTPIHNKMVDAFLRAPVHLIVTMRSKMEYVMEKDSSGKFVVNKIGLKPIQREGVEYEFDVIGDMNESNTMTISKSRCPKVSGKQYPMPGKEFAQILFAWCEGSGEAAPPEPPPPWEYGKDHHEKMAQLGKANGWITKENRGAPVVEILKKSFGVERPSQLDEHQYNNFLTILGCAHHNSEIVAEEKEVGVPVENRT